MIFDCCITDPQREMYVLMQDTDRLVQAKRQALEDLDKTYRLITHAQNMFSNNFPPVLEPESQPSRDRTPCSDCDCDVVLIFTGDDGKRYYDASMIGCDHYCPGCGQLHLSKNTTKGGN